MRRYLTLILFFILIKIIGQTTQEYDAIPNIFPQSQTASELGKYGSYPVNLSTGLPQIEIPIYTIKSGDLKLPITLKYHASGIKVNEESSWVGQNWSLDAGGIISLEVRDTPDELEPKINDIPDYVDVQNYLNLNPHIYNSAYLKDFTTYSRIKDAYHINLPSINGTFYMGDFGISKFPIDEYKVSRGSIIHDNALFVIVDKNGITYKFSDFEESQNLKTQNNPDYPTPHIHSKYKSAWLLNEIKSLKGDRIQLTYGNIFERYRSTESHLIQVENTSFSYDFNNCVGDQVNNKFYNFQIKPLEKSSRNIYEKTNKVKEIYFEGGRLRFVVGTGISQYSNQYLESIFVERETNLPAPGNYDPIKEYRFSYSTYNSIFSSNNQSERDKLKLNSVEEFNYAGSGTIVKTIAEFIYENSQIPRINSYSQDLFGFYNGSSNSSLIQKKYVPFERQVQPGQLVKTYYEIGNANRKVVPEFTQRGILKEIIHPTQGRTKFEYEPNTFWGTESIIPDIETRGLDLWGTGKGNRAPGDGIIDFNVSPPFNECISTCPPVVGYCCPAYKSTSYQTSDLVTSSNGKPFLLINYQVFCSGICDTTTAKYSKAKIRVHDSSGEVFSVNLKSGSAQNQYVELNSTGTATVSLEVWGDNVQANVQIVSQQKPYDNHGNMYAGGVRIKEISQHDFNDVLISKKKYVYSRLDDPSKSSGIIVNQYKENKYVNEDLKKIYTNKKIFKCEMPAGSGTIEVGNVTRHSNTSLHNFLSSTVSNIDRATVQYGNVTEIDLSATNTTKGKAEHDFLIESDIILTPDLYLNRPFLMGLLKNKWLYDETNNLVYHEKRNYEFKTNKNSFKDDFKLYRLYTVLENLDFPIYGKDNNICYEIVHAQFNDNWHVLKSKEMTNFYSQNDSLKTVEHYNYDEPLHQNITLTKVISPDFSERLNSYSYAHEKGNQYLIDKNMIGIPLETITTKKKDSADANGKVISQALTKYPTSQAEADAETNGLPLHYEVLSKDLQNATMHKEVSYDKYDDKGNILQYTVKNGVSTMIVWGYNKTQPIAKVEGKFNYLDIDNEAIAIVTASNNDATAPPNNDESTFLTALDTFRRSVEQLARTDVQITTYTYDPLIGVRSITPPSGIREVYIYDTANRLKEIREQSKTGRILKEFKYNYKP